MSEGSSEQGWDPCWQQHKCSSGPPTTAGHSSALQLQQFQSAGRHESNVSSRLLVEASCIWSSHTPTDFLGQPGTKPRATPTPLTSGILHDIHSCAFACSTKSLLAPPRQFPVHHLNSSRPNSLQGAAAARITMAGEGAGMLEANPGALALVILFFLVGRC